MQRTLRCELVFKTRAHPHCINHAAASSSFGVLALPELSNLLEQIVIIFFFQKLQNFTFKHPPHYTLDIHALTCSLLHRCFDVTQSWQDYIDKSLLGTNQVHQVSFVALLTFHQKQKNVKKVARMIAIHFSPPPLHGISLFAGNPGQMTCYECILFLAGVLSFGLRMGVRWSQ